MSHLEQNATQSGDIKISYNKMTVDVMAFGESTAKKLIRAFCHFRNFTKCHSTVIHSENDYTCEHLYVERHSTDCH